MSGYGLAAVIWSGIAVLGGLLLVLRHLEALHLTKAQVDAVNATVAALAKDLEDTKVKMAALGNRVR